MSDIWSLIGITLLFLGKPDKAILAFKRQIEVTPNHKWAWYGIGEAFILLEQPGKAMEAYKKQIKITPNHKRALNGLKALNDALSNW